MMDRRIIPLIMCGGAGTRLWPASREVRPKQFLPLFGARSTFQDTLTRVSDPALFERPIVITNAAYRFMVLEQLADIGIEADVLLEPMRRDSGPAIAAGGDEGSRIAHHVIGGQRQHDGVLVADLREHRTRGDRRPGIAPHRLQQHIGYETDLGQLLQHHETVGIVGDDDRTLEQRRIGHPLQGVLECRIGPEQRQELLGMNLARGRPQPGSSAAAHDQGNNSSVHWLPNSRVRGFISHHRMLFG